MPARTLSRLLIIALIAVTVISCSPKNGPAEPAMPTMLAPAEGSGQTGSIPTTGGLCDNILFPVKQGASWMYYSTGGPNGDFAYSDTITEVGSNGFILTSQFSNLTLSQKWMCSAEGLTALQLGGGTAASVSMQNMILEFEALEVKGLSLPREVTSGMTWQYDISLIGSVAMPGGENQSPGTFSLAMQELGHESVTVPVGTFDAVKMQATFNAQINADFQGSLVPYAVNGSSIIWYAPGVGYIKSIENIDFSGTTFTTTTELQSYNIP